MQNEKIEDKKILALSFYDKAAWYALAIPFAVVILGYVASMLISTLSRSFSVVDVIQQAIFWGALIIEFINFLSAVIICCAVNKHKRDSTVIIAFVGMVASVGAFVVTFIAFALSQMGRNC